jgi:hypothetical protein
MLLDILVDLKSAKPHGRSLSRASARLSVIGRQTLSPLGSAPCLQRHYIREEAPLGVFSQSIYRVSTETLVYPISEGAGRFGSSSSYRRRYRRRPEGHRRRGDAPALHRPASSLTGVIVYTNSDRRDGFLHYPVLDLFDLFRINLSTRCDLLLTRDPG